MEIRLSSLPPELRRLVLAQAGPKLPSAAPRRRAPARVPTRLSRVCRCRFEMFRPDGQYPDRCDGCGAPWPSRP